jgi:CHAT domain-containing protein
VNDRRVVIVPHGFLHQFPLHALFDGQSFLTERHAVSYSPSASVFYMARRRPQQESRGSVVVGLPDASMPAITDEVREIARLLPDSRTFLNGQATRANLYSEMPSARFVHIAAHGVFDEVYPDHSSVSLDDGPMTVRDLQAMKLSAELVVFSGCETGRTALRGCDELVGLTQGLLQAGARSALVALWRVADTATAAFMRAFWAAMNPACGRDESLQRAMTLHRADFPHPSAWAPFILVGDPGPIGTQPQLT